MLATPCNIDRFACFSNKVLDKYNSYFYEPLTYGIDAFSQTDYDKMVNFLHPPLSLMGRVTIFIQNEIVNSKWVIIFPKWCAQPWFM